MFSGCLADVYGMFRGCLGFRRRTDSQRNSDTEYQSEQKPPLACLGVVKAMFSGCLADLYGMFRESIITAFSSFVMSTSVVYSCARRRFLLTDVH